MSTACMVAGRGSRLPQDVVGVFITGAYSPGYIPQAFSIPFLTDLPAPDKMIRPVKRKARTKPVAKAKRNNKRVIARLKRRRRKMAKASRVRNRR